MKVLLVLLLAGACLSAQIGNKRNMAAESESKVVTKTEESLEDSAPVGKKKGETATTEEITTDDMEDTPDYLNDGALDNLQMFYDCSSGKSCKLVTGKGQDIGQQQPIKGDLELTRKIAPSLDMMAASLAKIKKQNSLLANLQREMAALNSLSNKGQDVVSKGLQPIIAPKGKGATLNLMSKGKGSTDANLLREAAMCPMLKFQVGQSQKVQYELKKQLENANTMNAIVSAQKAKSEQNLQSSELLREASKSEAQQAATALMMEKGQNNMLKNALAKEMAEKALIKKQKENLEMQLMELQAQLRNEKMMKEQFADALSKTKDEKDMCLSQLLMTGKAYEAEKKEKENALEELAKTTTELTITKAELQMETNAKKQCQNELALSEAKLQRTESELAEEKKAHAATQEELDNTQATLRATMQELAVTSLRLKQTQDDLIEKENDLARTQATLENTEDKLARTMATLESTRDELRSTKNALEEEKSAKAALEQLLGECNANLAATESSRQQLEEVKQKLEDLLASTQLALKDMTSQKNQMEAQFEQAMKLYSEEKQAKGQVEAALAEANAMKMQLAMQLTQALEMFKQAKQANEELNKMFEQVKTASALIQMQLEKLQLENIQLQAEVDKLRKEQEAALALAAGCPPGYEKFAGSCYKYIREKSPWKMAQQQCMSDGGNLVSIETLDEQAFVVDFLKRQDASKRDTHVYLGGFKKNMLWKWLVYELIVGRDTPDFWYSATARDKPNYDCMAMYLYDVNKFGKFTSRLCEVGTTYICEKNIVPPGMTKPSIREKNYLASKLPEMPAYLQAAAAGMNAMTKSANFFESQKGNAFESSKSANMLAARLANAKAANMFAASNAKAATLLAARNVKSANLLAAQANAKAANMLASSKASNMLAASLANAKANMIKAMAMNKGNSNLFSKGESEPYTQEQMEKLLNKGE